MLTSPETAAIMRVRYGKNCAGTFQEQAPGTWVDHFGVRVQLVPAGHVLGSCQIVLEYAGCTDRLSPPRLDKVTESDC